MATSTYTPMRSKLTKTFLMAAPAGGYLASNTGFPPIFEEHIASSMPARLAQWKRIVGACANGRNCHIYSSKDAYDTQHRAVIALLVEQSRINRMQ